MEPLRILWADACTLAALKPCGLPVQADQTGDADMLTLLRAQQEEQGIQLVHRLDRPVSGVVLFGRTPEAAAVLSSQFMDRSIRKVYWAIVEGRVENELILENNVLHDGRAHKARVAHGTASVQARLDVRPIAKGDRYTLLEVVPDGGAFHQIRVQLSTAGFPIKGDVKYGARRGEKDRSIALHARSIVFNQPEIGAPILVEAPMPGSGLWPVLAASGGMTT